MDNIIEEPVHKLEFFEAEDRIPIEKVDLKCGDFGFILYNVLSPNECKNYIEQSEKLGYISVSEVGYRKEYRNNDRCLVDGIKIATDIWERIKDYLPVCHSNYKIEAQDVQHIDLGLGKEGIWIPRDLNSRWRVCKYESGGHFSPHHDGNYVTQTQRSIYTFMLYLNGTDDYNGGSTNFLKEYEDAVRTDKGIYMSAEENIMEKIYPKPGMALCFRHNHMHEGGIVNTGVKYIMRSDVMFERIEEKELNPKTKEGLELLTEAEDLEAAGKNMEAAEKYRLAYKILDKL